MICFEASALQICPWGTTNLLFAQHWYTGEGPGIGTVLAQYYGILAVSQYGPMPAAPRVLNRSLIQ